ncbi:MAG TPA: SRPBCC domain-containing protein [Humisphaera sp.]
MSSAARAANRGSGAAAATPSAGIQTLDVRKETSIDAPPDLVWESLLEELGPAGEMPDGTPFPKTLEAWPGGRWFRDLGNNTGHLWGHVQVIKPPAVLEIVGPLFMSYPVASHLQYRLKADGKRTTLTLVHRAIGLIDPQHAEGVKMGWGHISERVQRKAEAKAGK